MEAWLAEDIGRGDLTAAALQGQQGQAHWVAKQPGRFCGGPLVQRLFQRLDPGVSLRLLRQDGDAVEVGDCLLERCGAAGTEGVLLALNQRQRDLAARAAEALARSQEVAAQQLPWDFWTIDLREAIRALGEITGEELTEAVLDRVFSRFCIGK